MLGAHLPDSGVPSRISPMAEQEVVTTTAQRPFPTVPCSLSDYYKENRRNAGGKDHSPDVFRFMLTNLIFPSDWSLTEKREE